MSEEINHHFTDEITCPHCGYEHLDSWERNDDGKDNCYECGREFVWSRSQYVKYSTSKPKEQ